MSGYKDYTFSTDMQVVSHCDSSLCLSEKLVQQNKNFI